MFQIVHQTTITFALSDKLSAQVDRLIDVISGQLSPDDQAALNGLLTAMGARVAKLEALDPLSPTKGV